MTARSLVDCGVETADDAADAVRRAFKLPRRPSLTEGPHGPGYRVMGRWVTATPSVAPAPTRCPRCGAAHTVTDADRVGERGERLGAEEALLTAHFRLAVAATSAGPFDLRGGRAA